ncbi:HAMP domain-containing histidine kinase [Actinotalea sp. M2MS4P-6]|uniref:sensor histidine kinase n=1 Tax=Actinotalea sp. M2MS4P-6 TaxID=2983762 RepID=UPI0021E4964C|nr:HAMP domain-containing sensor histidine kinase [Actinotalea sp. M2MS4P-6]MCV2393793.1 HAMP domain-containing histidine kinase [Actinotalea sp. M2MS4P-6]
MRLRLPTRLVAAFLSVLAIGTLVSLVTVRLIAPGIFERRMGMTNGRGMGGGQGVSATQDAFVAALDQSLLLGALVSALLAGVAAVLLARSMLRPLDAVRGATRTIAAGRYDVRVPRSGEPDVDALAADVNTLAGALADTETRRLRLLGEVAHEMRTPLTGLSGYVEGLEDGVFAPDEATLGAMDEDLRRLRRLADDLSALSRSEEGRTELRTAPCDLADLTARTCARLSDGLAGTPVRLTVVAPHPVPVVCDADRVQQVLTNLVGNAARAVRNGPGHEIRVVVDRVPGAATGTTSRGGPGGSGGIARVSVTDQGVGLTHEDLERVFERFYRVPGAERGEGSGIGLTISRSIARAHGGDLVATSPGPGHGATFTLTLPAAG